MFDDRTNRAAFQRALPLGFHAQNASSHSPTTSVAFNPLHLGAWAHILDSQSDIGGTRSQSQIHHAQAHRPKPLRN
jgi:hypothetical protein